MHLHILFLFLVIILGYQPKQVLAQEIEVPYVATPPAVVDKMLKMANVGEGDYLIDLGSGDGRIVIEAAKRGAVGHGVELDPELVETSIKNAKDAGVDGRVLFLAEDVFETDFSMASVITLYMSNVINLRLRPLFFETLKPGTRIVSHIFHMDDWKPDGHSEIDRHNIYYWVIPADAGGTWSWEVEETGYRLSLNQEFQEINEAAIKVSGNRKHVTVHEPKITGNIITMIMKNNHGSIRHVYHGRIEGDSIQGSVQIHKGDSYKIEDWNADRGTGDFQ